MTTSGSCPRFGITPKIWWTSPSRVSRNSQFVTNSQSFHSGCNSRYSFLSSESFWSPYSSFSILLIPIRVSKFIRGVVLISFFCASVIFIMTPPNVCSFFPLHTSVQILKGFANELHFNYTTCLHNFQELLISI